jgi:hypothetical protein
MDTWLEAASPILAVPVLAVAGLAAPEDNAVASVNSPRGGDETLTER